MNSKKPNEQENNYEINAGEANEVRRLLEEAKKHVAQIERQMIINRMKRGKAAKKAQREQ